MIYFYPPLNDVLHQNGTKVHKGSNSTSAKSPLLHVKSAEYGQEKLVEEVQNRSWLQESPL